MVTKISNYPNQKFWVDHWERNEGMFRSALTEDLSLAAIGRPHGLSRERVRQVILKMFVILSGFASKIFSEPPIWTHQRRYKSARRCSKEWLLLLEEYKNRYVRVLQYQ